MSASWNSLVAGAAGGVISTIVVHPLELAKVRLQVYEGTGVVAYRSRSTGTFQTLIDVYRTRGPRGLYLGLTPHILGASGAWAFNLFFFSTFKSYAQHNDPTRVLSTPTYLGCGALAGVFTMSIVNPVWVVKTRLMLQYETASLTGGTSQSELSTWVALKRLWVKEGLAGLYKGYLPGLVGVSHGAIQFTLYERFRNYYNCRLHQRPSNSKLVVRCRLQDQHRQYSGAVHVIRDVATNEGFFGFYKGLCPTLLRITPACAITFLVYEKTLQLLNSPTII